MAETRNKFLVAWLTALAGLSRAACFVLVSVSFRFRFRFGFGFGGRRETFVSFRNLSLAGS